MPLLNGNSAPNCPRKLFGATMQIADGTSTGANPCRNLNGTSSALARSGLGDNGSRIAGTVMPSAPNPMSHKQASTLPAAINRLEYQPAKIIPNGPAVSVATPMTPPAWRGVQPQVRMKSSGYHESPNAMME